MRLNPMAVLFVETMSDDEIAIIEELAFPKVTIFKFIKSNNTYLIVKVDETVPLAVRN